MAETHMLMADRELTDKELERIGEVLGTPRVVKQPGNTYYFRAELVGVRGQDKPGRKAA